MLRVLGYHSGGHLRESEKDRARFLKGMAFEAHLKKLVEMNQLDAGVGMLKEVRRKDIPSW